MYQLKQVLTLDTGTLQDIAMKFILLAIIGLTVAARTVCAGCPICGGGNSTLVDQVEQVKDLSVSWLAAQQNIDGSWPSLNTQKRHLGASTSGSVLVYWTCSRGKTIDHVNS
ncbi:hypothetical protein BSL78_29114 [Apostichopus japonicus]|uniref:Uncharacterized protein n=1 Tax=Stichopus japonicus TaxID=307972 RepID=A0A2G8JE91_STIJA|nr:hypothetical protein BSL78_29114 [Apostichopus japonicus]